MKLTREKLKELMQEAIDVSGPNSWSDVWVELTLLAQDDPAGNDLRSNFKLGDIVWLHHRPMEVVTIIFSTCYAQVVYNLVDHADDNQLHYEIGESALTREHSHSDEIGPYCRFCGEKK